MTEDVVRVDMDTTMRAIRERFEVTRFRHAVVIDEGRPVGVISDRDLLRTVSPFVGKLAERTQDLASLERKAHQVMTRELVTVRPESLAVDAALVMHDNRISCVPVVNCDGHCVGVFTWRNALAWAAEALGRHEGFCVVPGGAKRGAGKRAA